MTSGRASEPVLVDFHVYAWSGVPLQVAAERVRAATGLPVAPGWGSCRGTYHRWSGADVSDLLLQANVADEAGVPVEPAVAPGVPVLYATGLPQSALAALAALDGAVLVSADVVEVPRLPVPSGVAVPV